MESDFTLEKLLIRSPDVFNYDTNVFFEVKPGRMSPIFINIKNTLSNIELRKIISDSLVRTVPSSVDFICGIESGGSYYASILAERLNKPLVLYRKNDKKYAEKGTFVGIIPVKRDNVVIIDDVIVSGGSIEPAINNLRSLGCQIHVNAIFSYGHEDFLKKRLSINVRSVTNMNTFLNVAFNEKILLEKDFIFLKGFILQQRKKFV